MSSSFGQSTVFLVLTLGLPHRPTMTMEEKDQKDCWPCARRPGLTFACWSGSKILSRCPPVEQEKIKVEWMDYSGYPEYPQMDGPFEHAVSILDLIFNTGSSAGSFMKFIKKDTAQ